MKLRIAAVLILMSALSVQADPTRFEKIGPASSRSTVTIAAPGAGKRNCITDLTFTSTSTITMRILTGGTTTYEVMVTSNIVVPEHWTQDAPACGDVNATTTLKANFQGSTSNVDPMAYINYSGYVLQGR